MESIINILRRIVDKYDTKRGLRKKTIHMCHSWETRNRYKLPEWKTQEGEPLCSIYKDNRCCDSCDLSPTCDHAVDCNCFGYCFSALGGTTESKYMRKCSPYYKYGRMKKDGNFDWDYYKFNKRKEEFAIGEYIRIDDLNKLKISEEMSLLIEKQNIRIGQIVKKMDDNGFIELSLKENNIEKNFIINAYYNGLGSHTSPYYERIEATII